MHTKDIAVDKLEGILDLAQVGNWFECGINRINISEAASLVGVEGESGWREVVLWGVGARATQEENLGNLYISGIEGRKEEGKGFSLYGIKRYRSVSGKGEYMSSAAHLGGAEIPIGIGAGAVSGLPIGGQVFFIGCAIRTVSDEVRLPDSLERRLGQLSQLSENWDSYHARGISDKAIKKARSLLIGVCVGFGERQVGEVFVAPCSDGGLQLEWKLESEQELILKVSHRGDTATFLLIEPSRNGTFVEREGKIEEVEDWNRLFDEFVRAGDLR